MKWIGLRWDFSCIYCIIFPCHNMSIYDETRIIQQSRPASVVMWGGFSVISYTVSFSHVTDGCILLSSVLNIAHSCNHQEIRACSHKNEMHVFSANFDDYCVENICRAKARLHIFALYSSKLCSKIRTFILCEHALIGRIEWGFTVWISYQF